MKFQFMGASVKRVSLFIRRWLGDSVPIAILFIVGCGPSPVEKDFKLWIGNIKQTHNASELKAAASPLFQNFDVGRELPIRELPKEMLSAFRAEPFSSEPTMAHFIGEDKPGKRAVFILCGSGFGHWGIVVFQSGDDPSMARALHGNTVQWEEGVYFFLEK